ncbi:TenA family transcriptional regulator [Sphaerothrix gracilis]|uniref:TenA family transcriptional regulator n=1 Tax=Sphaerothrix gracilis TaxID=3151835 RepID=UPI0031FC7E1F
MSLTCQQLLQRHHDAWQSATVHPFLVQCQRGTIQARQFNTWLVQDFLFVTEFTRMAARLLAAAPYPHFAVLLSGLGALQAELSWFEAKASERSLILNTARQATCTEYCQFMASMADYPYAVQATAFWAIELAYNQGWQRHTPMPAPYAEFADRWGNPEFTQYVKLLEQQADEGLAEAPPGVQQQAEAAFSQVAQLEQAFWQMAFEG